MEPVRSDLQQNFTLSFVQGLTSMF